jgi:hypothetical protein
VNPLAVNLNMNSDWDVEGQKQGGFRRFVGLPSQLT